MQMLIQGQSPRSGRWAEIMLEALMRIEVISENADNTRSGGSPERADAARASSTRPYTHGCPYLTETKFGMGFY